MTRDAFHDLCWEYEIHPDLQREISHRYDEVGIDARAPEVVDHFHQRLISSPYYTMVLPATVQTPFLRLVQVDLTVNPELWQVDKTRFYILLREEFDVTTITFIERTEHWLTVPELIAFTYACDLVPQPFVESFNERMTQLLKEVLLAYCAHC